MLTQDEKDYLEKIPADKKVVIRSYDSSTAGIAGEFIAMIKSVDPRLEVVYLGASSLEISGQGDIDLSIMCPKSEFQANKEKLSKVLGKNISGSSTIEWCFERNGHEVSVYLADLTESSTARQLKMQEILKKSPDLLREYEQLKEKAASLGYREYQRQKYEFYNKILNKFAK